MDRMLVTPVRRASIITARVLHAALTVVTQAIIIIILGVSFPGGILGILSILLFAAFWAAVSLLV